MFLNKLLHHCQIFALQLGEVDNIKPEGISKDLFSSEKLSFLLSKALAYTFIIAGFLSILYIIYGGIKLIVSGGDKSKIETAHKTIKYAIIGLLITILSFTIISFIGTLWDLELVRYISFEQIVKILSELF